MIKINWKIILCVVLIIFALFAVSRYEGFQAGMPGIRCGKDLNSCSSGKQCINGFCGKTDKPQLLANQLPVFP
jgi:hypothetical protein